MGAVGPPCVIVLISEVNRSNYGRLLLSLRMQQGGTDVDMGAERHGTENGVEIARSEPDAAATRRGGRKLGRGRNVRQRRTTVRKVCVVKNSPWKMTLKLITPTPTHGVN